jgi:hypothetical protein
MSVANGEAFREAARQLVWACYFGPLRERSFGPTGAPTTMPVSDQLGVMEGAWVSDMLLAAGRRIVPA